MIGLGLPENYELWQIDILVTIKGKVMTSLPFIMAPHYKVLPKFQMNLAPRPDGTWAVRQTVLESQGQQCTGNQDHVSRLMKPRSRR
jgi:hypothetical protein